MHRNIKILLTASIFIHSGTNLLAPVFAIYIKDIGGTVVEAGIAVGIYAVIKSIFYFLFNKISRDRLSHRLMISSGYFIMGAGYLLYVFASMPLHIYLIQVVLSAGETIITPSWSAVIAKSLEKGKERHIYSHFYGYRSFFEGVGAVLGGLFAYNFGFNTVFIFMFILAAASGIISFFINE